MRTFLCLARTERGEEMSYPNNPTVLRLPAVLQVTALSRSTIYAMIADGDFPRPIKLGKRAVGWKQADVMSWLESRCQEVA